MRTVDRSGHLLVAVEGLSGAGKTTVSRQLAGRLDAEWIEEAYARIRPAPTLRFRDDRELLRIERRLISEDFQRYDFAKSRRTQQKIVVLDTDFLGPLTYVWGLCRRGQVHLSTFDSIRRIFARAAREGRWGLADLYVYLDVASVIAARRAARSPRTHPRVLGVRHRAVGIEERKIFTRLLPGILPGRVITVSADGPPEAVVRRIARRIPSTLTAVRSARKRALDLLSELDRDWRPRRPGNR